MVVAIVSHIWYVSPFSRSGVVEMTLSLNSIILSPFRFPRRIINRNFLSFLDNLPFKAASHQKIVDLCVVSSVAKSNKL
ncbi:hypothetical protein HanRHA438_Chr09g0397091 [Helianthus annuus]|nr:hypothetical protein HanRHA438_Chr09g0397091 [Helianthus annuus]